MSKEFDTNTNELGAKERIMWAATEVFAEKGFDAAGVDEIAKRADVTKPLIYYYFESKKEILDKLIIEYLNKIQNEKKRYFSSMTKIDKDMLYAQFEERVKTFSDNKKILKIIAMEMLKEKPVADSILDTVYNMFDASKEKFKNSGLKIEEPLDIIVPNFFFGTVPLLIYMLFADEFCSYNNVERKELDKRFFRAMKSVFLDYFIERLGESDIKEEC